MREAGNKTTKQELPPWMERGHMEFQLRTEIAFWCDLAESCGTAVPPESIERMQQALALAESRLRQLYFEPERDRSQQAVRAGQAGPAAYP